MHEPALNDGGSAPDHAPAPGEGQTAPEAPTPVSGPEPQVATFSLARTMAAMCLLGVLGGIAVLKPFPQGVHASDIRYIEPPDALPSGALTPPTQATMTIQDASGRIVRSELARSEAEAWRSLGELIGPKFTVRIELLGDETLYTLLDASGQALATRMTRAQLASLYPSLDLDSLTASGESLRLMMATERTGD